MEVENNGNVIFAPSFIKVDQDEINLNQKLKNNQSVNASSMLTYSKIVCCICGITMDANSEGICEVCAKKNIDITTGITRSGIVTYCHTCQRYKRPPWMKIEKESQDMMNLCLSKIKGLNKVQLIDSSFVWTEPHSKEIKIKLTIQKEINKSLISTSFIVELKEEWTQCEDCKKTFTPHIWRAAVQLRQKVNHKRTFLFLEQVILKHKAQAKALNIKEHPEGVDFYFANRAQANSFCAFIHEFLPCQTKTSRQLISVDEKSNEAVYKETFRLEIAPVCQDDLIILSEENYKKLGSIGPVLLCYKQINNLKFIDPVTFETIDLDNNTYWRYGLKSYIDRKCLSEFLILSCEEEIDYKKVAEKDKSKRVIKKIVNNKKKNNGMDIENDSKINESKSDVNKLKSEIASERATGGGDGPEDWVGAYDMSLNNIAWRNGTRLIIHIADAPAHGSQWCEENNHEEENSKLYPMVQKCVDKNIKIIGFQIGSSPKPSFTKFQNEYNSRGGILYKIQEFNNIESSKISEHFRDMVVESTHAAAPK